MEKDEIHMMQTFNNGLYVLATCAAGILYLKNMPRRIIKLPAFWMAFTSLVLAGTVFFCYSYQWYIHFALFFLISLFIHVVYKSRLTQSLFLSGLLFLGFDSNPRVLHYCFDRFLNEHYVMCVNPERPWIPYVYIGCMFLMDVLMALILRRFIPPEKSHYSSNELLVYLVIIFIPILYVGESDHLRSMKDYLPASIQVLRLILCYYSLSSLIVFHQMLRNRENQQEATIIRRLMEEQHKQYLLRQDTIDELNKQCHDLRHQLALLQYASSPDLVKQYSDQITQVLEKNDRLIQTGNTALDLILMKINSQCLKNGILLTYMVDAEALTALSDMDICTIFDNALDNAVEAASSVSRQENRVIDMKVTQKGSLVYISFTNYFENKLNWQNGMLRTSKSKKYAHGYGIKSIRVIVEQHNGEMTIFTENHWFSIRIVIPLANEMKEAEKPVESVATIVR